MSSALLAAILAGPALSPRAGGPAPEVIAVPGVSDTGPRPDLAKAADVIVQRTNAFRAAERRGPTTVDPKLLAAARYFAGYMARTDRYGHTADGAQPAERAVGHAYAYCLVLENIAHAYDSEGFDQDKLAGVFVTGWKESPGHRRNMLDPDATNTAVAVARSEKTGHYYAVQMFGRPKSAAVEFRVENRSGEAVEYALGGQPFALPPRVVRTHSGCRPEELVFRWPGGKTTASTPAAGDRLTVTKDGDEFRVATAKDKPKE